MTPADTPRGGAGPRVSEIERRAIAAEDLVEHMENAYAQLSISVGKYIKVVADLSAKLAEAERYADRLSDEMIELRQAPWPEWAEACLKIVRDCNGAVDEEADLPEELEELLSEWDDYEKKWRVETARADAAEAALRKVTEERDRAFRAGRDAVVAEAHACRSCVVGSDAWAEGMRDMAVRIAKHGNALTPPAETAVEEGR